MSRDPQSLAEEISEDLAPSEIPENLRSLPKAQLEEIHAAIVQDIEAVKRRLTAQQENEDERLRLEAIRQIKQGKLSTVENELAIRWSLLPMAPDALTTLSYAELHEIQDAVVGDLQKLKPKIEINADLTSDLPQLYRLKALVRYRKGEQKRLINEFARRKALNLGQDRFLVRRASADPAELEAYLNTNIERGCARWPHSIVGMGDHVLVVWKTREPSGKEEI